MFEMLAAAKKAVPYPTDCPFLNDLIVNVLWWLL